MTRLAIRRQGAALLLSLALIAGQPARAELPVIDVQSIFQQIQSYLTQVKQWVQEQLSYTTQLQQLAHELQTDLSTAMLVANFIHAPTLGALMELMGMTGLENNLPINPAALQGLLAGYSGMNGLTGIIGTGSSKLSQLSSLVQGSYTANNLYHCTSTDYACTQNNTRMAGLSGQQGALSLLYSEITNHTQVLQQARNQLLTTSDPKTVADLQAQIQTEIAYLQSQTAQAQIVIGLSNAQQQISAAQDNQKVRADLDAFSGTLQSAGAVNAPPVSSTTGTVASNGATYATPSGATYFVPAGETSAQAQVIGGNQ
jgi:type IV secretion system protein VirB5